MGLVWTRRTDSHDPSSTCRTQIKTEAAIGAQAQRRRWEEAAALHHFELHCYVVRNLRAPQHQLQPEMETCSFGEDLDGGRRLAAI